MSPAVIGTMIPIVGCIAVFTFLTVVVVSNIRARLEERKALYDTAKAAVEKGQPLPPEVIAAMASQPEKTRGTAFHDLRTGAIILAAGVGVAVIGAILSWEDQEVSVVLGGAALITLIGVAFLVMSRFNPNKG